jgi:ubiquitin carboxyl-terminal hydrolase 48
VSPFSSRFSFETRHGNQHLARWSWGGCHSCGFVMGGDGKSTGEDVVMVTDHHDDAEALPPKKRGLSPNGRGGSPVKKQKGSLISPDKLMEVYGLANTVPCKLAKGATNSTKVKCAQNPNCIHTMLTPFTKKSGASSGIWKKTENGVLAGFQKVMLFNNQIEASWSLSERESMEIPVGMRNLGATCYMNCLLQCLFMNRRFRAGIFSYEHTPTDGHHQTIHQLQLLFGQLLLSKRKFVDPSDLVQHLNLEASIQQDVQEFNRLFLSHLENQLKKSDNPIVSNLVRGLFGGSMTYFTTCDVCNTKSPLTSEFYELSLQLKGFKTLQSSLQNFFLPELLHGPNQYYCGTCKAKRDAHRNVVMNQKGLPQYLNFQLMRFVVDVSSLEKVKVKSRIEIPFTIPCEEIARGDQNAAGKEYRLQAVFQHLGESAYSGHYAVDIFDDAQRQWFKFDDEKVTEKSQLGADNESDVVEDTSRTSSSNAYMLVYKLHDSNSMDLVVPDVPVAEWIDKSVAVSNLEFQSQIDLYQHQTSVVLEFVNDRKKRVEEFIKELEEIYSDDFNFVNSFRDPRKLVVIPRDWLKHWLYGTNMESPSKDSDESESKEVIDLDATIIVSEEIPVIELDPVVEPQKILIGSLDEEKAKFNTDYLSEKYPGVLTLDSYLCPHRSLNPQFVSDLKVLPRKLWDVLHVKQEPVHFLDVACDKCSVEMISGLEEGKAVDELAEQLLNLLKFDSGDVESGFWFLKTWLTQLRNCAKTKKNYDRLFVASFPSTEKIDLSTDEQEPKRSVFLDSLLGGVRCPHGNLSLDLKSRKLISLEATQALFQFLEKAVGFCDCTFEDFLSSAFQSQSLPCSDCLKDTESKTELKNEKNEEIIRLKSLYSRKFADSFPHPQAAPSPGIYYLLPYGWYSYWKQYLSDINNSRRPGAIVLDSLLCQHSHLYFNPVPLSEDSNHDEFLVGCSSGVMVLAREDEWKALIELYSTDGKCREIKVTYSNREHVPTSLLSTWENLEVDSFPPICHDCISARLDAEKQSKKSFVNGEITVSTISSEPFATDVSNGSSSVKRSRRARANNRKHKSCVIEVSSGDTLMSLRLKIFEQLDVNPIAQRLFLGTKELKATMIDGEEDDPTLQSLGIMNHSTVNLLISDKNHNEDDEDAFIMKQISRLEAQERKNKSNEPEVGFRGTKLSS